jgi:hypothetical protein
MSSQKTNSISLHHKHYQNEVFKANQTLSNSHCSQALHSKTSLHTLLKTVSITKAPARNSKQNTTRKTPPKKARIMKPRAEFIVEVLAPLLLRSMGVQNAYQNHYMVSGS